MARGDTKYSEQIPGARGNYKWGARYDLTTNGYLGITQFEGTKIKDRVLLSPRQVNELVAFAKPKKKK